MSEAASLIGCSQVGGKKWCNERGGRYGDAEEKKEKKKNDKKKNRTRKLAVRPPTSISPLHGEASYLRTAHFDHYTTKA